jgi:hypothetical protein
MQGDNDICIWADPLEQGDDVDPEIAVVLQMDDIWINVVKQPCKAAADAVDVCVCEFVPFTFAADQIFPSLVIHTADFPMADNAKTGMGGGKNPCFNIGLELALLEQGESGVFSPSYGKISVAVNQIKNFHGFRDLAGAAFRFSIV